MKILRRVTLFLFFAVFSLCVSGVCSAVKLLAVDKVIVLEISGETAYPTGKTTGIVKRLGKIRETGRQHCPIGGKGVSYWVEVYNNGVKHAFLCDTGNEGIILKYNFPYFHKDPSDLEAIAITHGHSDHYGGLKTVINMIKENTSIPVMVGSDDAFNERFFFKGGKVTGTWTWDRSKNKKANFVITNEPKIFLQNQALFTGPVKRKTLYEGIKTPWRKKINGELVKDVMLEDSALVFNVKGKGLVVLAACDHSGLINTLTYAKSLTGVDKIYAYMGSIQKVTDKKAYEKDFRSNKPLYFISTHCTENKPGLLKIVKKVMDKNYNFSKVGSEFTFDSNYQD